MLPDRFARLLSRPADYVARVTCDERTVGFVLDHLMRRGLSPLCMLDDGNRPVVVAADGDELVVVSIALAGVERLLAVRLDRVTVDLSADEPVGLDHEEALARWASPS